MSANESLLGLIFRVYGTRIHVRIRDMFTRTHKHMFRKGDVMANPESKFCRCYLCGENVNIMDESP